MHQPVVSIIVPCYNQAQYLTEALDSVIKQSFEHWECIIVNDGSHDNTEHVALKYVALDKRFKYFFQNNAGLSAARNFGIKMSQGEFILPWDSDDYFEPIYTEKAVEILAKNSSIGAVTCFISCFVDSGAVIHSYKPKGGNIVDFLYLNNACGNSMFRKTTWDLIGGYDEAMKHGYEDWEFWIRLTSRKLSIHVIPEYLFNYRKSKGSMLESSRHLHHDSLKKYLVTKHENLYCKDLSKTIDFLQESIFIYRNSEKKRINSLDFRIGKFILTPFRFVKKVINKN